MKKINVITFISCIFLSIFSINTIAGSRPGALNLTFGGGHEFFASKREMENTGVKFIALGYDFTPRWGIEGFFAFLHTHFKDAVQDERSIDGNIFAIDGVYHYPFTPAFEAYLLFGPGITILNPNHFDAVDEGNVNAGIGLQYFVHPQIAFRAEVRDFYVIHGGKNDVLLDGAISFFFDLC